MSEFKKLEDMSFREYDRKFVLVKNATNLLNNIIDDEELELNGDIKEPFYGFLYIDHQCGVTLNILGNDKNKDLYVNKVRLIARCDELSDVEFKIINDNEYKYSKEVLEYSKVYYEDYIVETREDKLLDKFRYSLYPDDVEVVLPTKKGLEKLWARLILKREQDDLYVAELLNNSDIDSDYKVGSKVAIVYYTKSDDSLLVISGIIKN